jgi:hypothetical protein
MTLSRGFAFMVWAISVAGCGVAAADDVVDTAPAMSAAQGWLGLIDGERYGAGWEAASETFRTSVEKPKWETRVAAARGPLGGVIMRKVRSASFTRTPDGTDGAGYVVIQYDTRFENRPLSTETVTTVRESDASWRVADYAIK